MSNVTSIISEEKKLDKFLVTILFLNFLNLSTIRIILTESVEHSAADFLYFFLFLYYYFRYNNCNEIIIINYRELIFRVHT